MTINLSSWEVLGQVVETFLFSKILADTQAYRHIFCLRCKFPMRLALWCLHRYCPRFIHLLDQDWWLLSCRVEWLRRFYMEETAIPSVTFLALGILIQVICRGWLLVFCLQHTFILYVRDRSSGGVLEALIIVWLLVFVSSSLGPVVSGEFEWTRHDPTLFIILDLILSLAYAL